MPDWSAVNLAPSVQQVTLTESSIHEITSPALVRVGGHGENGDSTVEGVGARSSGGEGEGGFDLPNLGGSFESAHDGHVEVHQDDVEGGVFLHGSDGHPAVLYDDNLVPFLLESPFDEHRVDGLVLRKESVSSRKLTQLSESYLDDEDLEGRIRFLLLGVGAALLLLLLGLAVLLLGLEVANLDVLVAGG